MVKSKKSLAETHPQLLEEWDYEKNNLNPEEVTYGSKRTIWWKCKNNHQWKNTPRNRTKKDKVIECPYCSRFYPSPEYNLFTENPRLCKEWDYAKNTQTPKHFLPNSHTYVWWKCSKCTHSWEASISNRNRNRGCPNCKAFAKSSFPETALYYYFKKVFNDCEHRYQLQAEDSFKELDIFIPSLNVAIEYDGHYHLKTKEKDELKNEICEGLGIKLFRIRCSSNTLTLPNLENFNSTVLYHDLHSDFDTLGECILSIAKSINKSSQFKSIVDIKRDEYEIRKLYRDIDIEGNLKEKSPDIADQWNNKKNKGLKPESFTPYSNVKVWWMCEKGHEWSASINSRHKAGCPYCSNKKLCLDNCLATVNPELAKEWHLKLNGNLTPFDVFPSTSLEVWWLCENNHEWKSSLNNRSRGTGCPKCHKPHKRTNKKVFMFVEFPELLSYWDFNKNGLLEVAKITVGSHRKVHWKCPHCYHTWISTVNYTCKKAKDHKSICKKCK